MKFKQRKKILKELTLNERRIFSQMVDFKKDVKEIRELAFNIKVNLSFSDSMIGDSVKHTDEIMKICQKYSD